MSYVNTGGAIATDTLVLREDKGSPLNTGEFDNNFEVTAEKLNDLDSRIAGEGIYLSGGSTSYPTLAEAVAAIGGVNPGTIILRHTSGDSETSYPVTADLTISKNITLSIQHGAKVTVATGVTLKLGRDPLAGRYKIFDCTGTGKVIAKRDSGDTGLCSLVYPEWWGAVGDARAQEGTSGTTTVSRPASGTDDSAAFQAALNFFCPEGAPTYGYNADYVSGGVVSLRSDGRYLLQSMINVPVGVTIKGNLGPVSGQLYNLRRLGSALVCDPSGITTECIRMHNNSKLEDLIVLNHNLEFLGYNYTSWPSWSGTAVRFQTVNGSPSGISLENLMVAGFEYGIYHRNEDQEGVWGGHASGSYFIDRVYVDCINAIYIAGTGNFGYLDHIYAFHYATYNSPNAVSHSRTGKGIYLLAVTGGVITNSFVRGYKTGYHIGEWSNWVRLVGCDYEGSLEDATQVQNIGFLVGEGPGESAVVSDAQIIGCMAVTGATSTPSYGFYVNTDPALGSHGEGRVLLSNCKAYGCNYGYYNAVDSEKAYFTLFSVYNNSVDFYVRGTEKTESGLWTWSLFDYIYSDHSLNT